MKDPLSPYISGWRFTLLIATLILSVVGYFLFTLWGGWDKVTDAVEKVGFTGLLLLLSTAFASYIFRFCRWNYFLHVLGYRLPLPASFRIYIAGFSLTTTPGKAGEALRSVFLREHGVIYRKSVGAFLSERLSDLIAVALLAAGGLAAYPKARPVVIFTALFILFILYAIQKDSWLKSFEKWALKRLPVRFAHLIEFAIETMLAVRSCFSIPVLLSGIFFGCLAWGLEGVMLFFLMQILGSPIPLFSAIFIHAFALLVGALTFLPGGLGGAEVTLYNLLLFYGAPASTAVAATIVLRLCTLWFSVLLGLIALPKKHST